MTSLQPPLFRSFFQGGFECSSHRRRDGRRLDIISATRHDALALRDYRALSDLGIYTVRDGIRWHLIETQPNRYDFSSVTPMLRAANVSGTEVIWDLFHFGWPDDLDIFSSAFVSRFEKFSRAFAYVLRNETDGAAWICPVNEVSFVAWGGGEAAYLNPFQKKRGYELKTQLIRAAIASTQAIRDVLPQCRTVFCEPAIHIVADPQRPQDGAVAEAYRRLQFQSLDMLTGRENPNLGGATENLDVVGLNFYSNNQWVHEGRTLQRGDPLYRPLRRIIREFYERFRRPLFLSETGIEGERRPGWLAYVADEVLAARESGVPVHGICLYPIANHPGWDNDRHCHNGLLDYPDENGKREIYEPLASELRRQQKRFNNSLELDRVGVGA